MDDTKLRSQQKGERKGKKEDTLFYSTIVCVCICEKERANKGHAVLFKNCVCLNINKPIQDGGEAKAPLWLNRLSGTN